MGIPRNALVVVLVLALPQVARAVEFDRTLPASPGTRLDVRLFGGEVTVRTWDKDAVRVHATHFETDEITCEAAGKAIIVRARTRAGAPHGIDLEIQVPAWMAISVVGPYVDVTASGTRADITVETVRGDIRVTGGNGTVALSSIEGQVVLEDARGTARLRAANNGIRVTRFEGTLRAETVDGSVRLRQVAASEVEVTTTAGDILWEGPLAAAASCELVTHSGDIDVTLPSAASATVTVHALEGHVRSLLAPPAHAGTDGRTYVVGSGGPRLILESFNGIISLRQAADPR